MQAKACGLDPDGFLRLEAAHIAWSHCSMVYEPSSDYFATIKFFDFDKHAHRRGLMGHSAALCCHWMGALAA